jgi:hypothetical protein
MVVNTLAVQGITSTQVVVQQVVSCIQWRQGQAKETE